MAARARAVGGRLRRGRAVNVERLLRMDVPELAGRARQELCKRLERVGLLAPDSPLGVFGRLAGTPELAPIRERARGGDRPGAARALFDRFVQGDAGRFFEGAWRLDTPALLDRHVPGARAELVASAESICRGRFDLLGYEALDFGDPVDWHLDPISDRRAPLVHWSRIDPLDPDQAGDSKVVWELNRHQWMVRLGQAYRLTGDERYAETFAEAMRRWLRANPPGLGINWASSLEVALRLIAWCWSLALFRGAGALSAELYTDIVDSAGAHARHIQRYLSHYFSPNTHLTGEALGLFYAGTVFPELEGAARWREVGQSVLVAESARQVLADGVHFELSTCYHRYTAEIYLHLVLLAAANRLTLAPEVGQRLERLIDVLLAMRRPDGSMPQIGDADGGVILPLAPRAPGDVRGLFATAAAVFRRPDFAWAADGACAEALWLLGPSAVATAGRPAPRPPETPPCRVFPQGGYVVMRSGWDRHAHQLIFDVGPLGCPVTAGHGHADLLSVQCAVFGEPYLVDPGTYCYTAAPEWREFFRSTAAHSTVRIDRTGQAAPDGPFAWQSRPRAHLTRWVSTDTLDVADGEHAAYARLADPVVHRRRVLWVKPRYWVVVDDLSGRGEHEVELRFQFAPLPVTVSPALWARARGAGGHGLLVHPFAAVPLKAEVLAGEPAPIQGWVSEDYGRRRAAPVLVYSTVARLPIRIATLLLPIEDAGSEPPSMSMLVGEGPVPAGLSFHGDGETVRFGAHEDVVSSHAGRGNGLTR
jgi:heparinase II/III-like protein